MNCTNRSFWVAALILSAIGCASVEQGTSRLRVDPPAGGNIVAVSSSVRDRFAQAIEAMRAGDDATAKGLLISLTNANPQLSGPFVNLGLLNFHAGNMDEAEKDFNQALKVNSNSAVSYNHLGIINRTRGNFKQAKGLYKNALSINDDYANAHLNLGILLDLYLGELPDALVHYERYQSITTEEDKNVKNWIVDLKRRIKRAKR